MLVNGQNIIKTICILRGTYAEDLPCTLYDNDDNNYSEEVFKISKSETFRLFVVQLILYI